MFINVKLVTKRQYLRRLPLYKHNIFTFHVYLFIYLFIYLFYKSLDLLLYKFMANIY